MGHDFTTDLRLDALQGARIGVVASQIPPAGTDNLALWNAATAALTALGATLVPVTLDTSSSMLTHGGAKFDYARQLAGALCYVGLVRLDTIEIHADAIQKGDRVLLIDDLIATGGTAEAATELIRRSGGELVAAAFVIDLPDLGGAKRLAAKDVVVHTLVSFEGH